MTSGKPRRLNPQERALVRHLLGGTTEVEVHPVEAVGAADATGAIAAALDANGMDAAARIFLGRCQWLEALDKPRTLRLIPAEVLGCAHAAEMQATLARLGGDEKGGALMYARAVCFRRAAGAARLVDPPW